MSDFSPMDVLFFYPWRNIFAHALSEVLCHELWCGGWCRPHNLGREALSVCFREWTPVVFHSLGGAVECMEPMGATLLRNIGNVVCTMRLVWYSGVGEGSGKTREVAGVGGFPSRSVDFQLLPILLFESDAGKRILHARSEVRDGKAESHLGAFNLLQVGLDLQ